MANNDRPEALRLPQEMIDKMKANRALLDHVEKDLEILKKHGLATAEIERQLSWAKEVGDELLKQFG